MFLWVWKLSSSIFKIDIIDNMLSIDLEVGFHVFWWWVIFIPASFSWGGGGRVESTKQYSLHAALHDSGGLYVPSG